MSVLIETCHFLLTRFKLSFAMRSELNPAYYEEVKGAYHKIFHRAGFKAIYTLAAGGVFTANNTHEFQIASLVGEDTIYVCRKCEYAENKEISQLKSGGHCPKCDSEIEETKAIEVGNIFPYGDKYSKAVDLKFVDENGDKQYVITGAYGIGVGRVMGTVVEIHHDDRGIIWPEAIAPFRVHLICLDEAVRNNADDIYKELQEKNIEVLYDDRADKTAGEKFADADLIGIPTRLIVSKKTVEQNSVELKKRSEKDSKLVGLTSCIDLL